MRTRAVDHHLEREARSERFLRDERDRVRGRIVSSGAESERPDLRRTDHSVSSNREQVIVAEVDSPGRIKRQVEGEGKRLNRPGWSSPRGTNLVVRVCRRRPYARTVRGWAALGRVDFDDLRELRRVVARPGRRGADELAGGNGRQCRDDVRVAVGVGPHHDRAQVFLAIAVACRVGFLIGEELDPEDGVGRAVERPSHRRAIPIALRGR